MRLKSTAILLAAIALPIAVSACGGSSKPSKSSTSATATQPGAAGAPTSSVTTGPVHARLVCPDHSPKVGKGWAYSVHVSDASGHPLSGSVDIEFTFGGQVVGRDTPPTHPIRNGLWHDVLTFPRAALGYSLVFQAIIHTKQGSVTLGWPVRAQP